MLIRPESSSDIAAIRAVNCAAFKTPLEAGLVDLLRAGSSPFISLVAQDASGVVGHIALSPGELRGAPGLRIAGVGPVAVHPAHQRRGIGGRLVAAGTEAARAQGFAALCVLGSPQFYPRFGFLPASHFGISCEYDVPGGAFMAQELFPGAVKGHGGLFRYHAAFTQAGV